VDAIGFLIAAIVVVAVIVLVARRWRADEPRDRGPYSTAMEARGGFAALGTTIDEPPDREPEDSLGGRPRR
jgi:hypothetical protein